MVLGVCVGGWVCGWVCVGVNGEHACIFLVLTDITQHKCVPLYWTCVCVRSPCEIC